VLKLVTILDETAVVSAVAAILLAVFTVIQLRHMEKHRNVDVSMKLFEWAETDRLRKAFRWMDKKYQFKNYPEYKLWEEKDIEASEYPFEVTAFFEQVGFLVERKFVDLDIVADRLGHYVILNWRKLEPWIAALQKEKKDSTYGEHFQHLYQLTFNYMKKRCAPGETNFCTDIENTH
jgi:hypothetical protein